jgi:hypothetical protein
MERKPSGFEVMAMAAMAMGGIIDLFVLFKKIHIHSL